MRVAGCAGRTAVTISNRDSRIGQGASGEERRHRAGRGQGRVRGQASPLPTGDPAADRDATRAEGVACYQLFISGLLDVTDNVDHATASVNPARGGAT